VKEICNIGTADMFLKCSHLLLSFRCRRWGRKRHRRTALARLDRRLAL